jgi:hypothetical protein
MPSLDADLFGDIDEAGASPTPSPTPLTPSQGDEDLFGDVDAQERQKMQQSMYNAAKKDPARQADVVRLSSATGKDPDFVGRNYDELANHHSVTGTDYAEIQRKTPGLGRFLTNSTNASIVKDDLETSAKIDRSAWYYTKGIRNASDVIYNTAYALGLDEIPLAGTSTARAALGGFNDLNIFLTNAALGAGKISPEFAAEFNAENYRTRKYLDQFDLEMMQKFSDELQPTRDDFRRTTAQFFAGAKKVRDGAIADGISDLYAGGKASIGEVVDLLGVIADNPGAGLYTTVKTLAPSLPAMAAATALAPVLGVPGFLAFGRFGAMIGTGLGIGVGTYLGEYPVEFGGTFEEKIAESKIDQTSAEELLRMYSDPKFMAQAKSESNKKAVGTALPDALLAPFGGLIFRGIAGRAGANMTRKAVGTVAGGLFEMGTESFTEATGKAYQYDWDVSKIDWADVTLEGLLSPGQSIASTVITSRLFGQNKEFITRDEMQSAFTEAMGHKAPTPAPTEFRGIIPNLYRKYFGTDLTRKGAAITRDVMKARTSIEKAEALFTLGENISASKLIERNLPEKAKELISEATNNDPDAKVYFQTQDLEDLAKKNNLPVLDLAKALMEDQGQAYIEARDSGSPLAVPLANFVLTFNQTGAYEDAVSIARPQEDAPSTREATEFLRDLPKRMDALAKQSTDSFEQSKLIGTRFAQEAIAAGRSKDEARKAGLLVQKRLDTLASKSGLTPQQIDREFKIIINSERLKNEIKKVNPEADISSDEVLPEGAEDFDFAEPVIEPVQNPEDRKKFIQTIADSIRDLKTTDPVKKKKTKGKSLLTFIKEKGGISSKYDRGDVGDLEIPFALRSREGGGWGIDQMTSLLNQAGYPIEEFDTNALLDALRNASKGKHLYPTASMAESMQNEMESREDASFRRQIASLESEMPGATAEQLAEEWVNRFESKTLFQKAPPTNSEAFKAWFGDSKVVDENGKPMVVYHQTHKDNVPKIEDSGFDTSKVGARRLDEMVPDGIFLKPTDKDIGVGGVSASEITQIPLFVSLKNPLIVSDRRSLSEYISRHSEEYIRLSTEMFRSDNENKRAFEEFEKTNGNDIEEAESRLDKWNQDLAAIAAKSRAVITDLLRSQGYDGLIVEHDTASHNRSTKSIIAFDPTQVKSIFNRGTFDANDPRILYQTSGTTVSRDVAPTFYHAIQRTIDQKIQGKSATVEQVRAIVKNLSPEEVKWSGIEEFLKGKTKVDKAELVEFLRVNAIEIEEVVKGLGFKQSDENLLAELEDREPDTIKEDGLDSTKFSQYQLPGGKNYRELLLRLPEERGVIARLKSEKIKELENRVLSLREQHRTMPAFSDGRAEVGLRLREAEQEHGVAIGHTSTIGKFKSGHFDETNILAHVRFNDRTDADGNRVLFLEEIQADKAKKWKTLKDKIEKGTASDAEKNEFKNLDENFPFNKLGDWTGLVLKRMIRYAAENGYDKIAWTTGEQQAERYDLSKHLESIRIQTRKDGDINLYGFSKENGDLVIDEVISYNDLPDYVGKDAFDKIEKMDWQHDSDGEFKKLEGEGLKVGGEGMKGFYDKIVPKAAEKIARKFDKTAKVESLNIKTKEGVRKARRVGTISHDGKKYWVSNDGEKISPEFDSWIGADDWRTEVSSGSVPVHSLAITPAIRDAALSQGFSLFQDTLGKITIRTLGEQTQFEISMLEKANKSTLLHELGHAFLEIQKRLADRSPVLKSDWQKIADWLGLKPGEELTVEMHERFADTWEAYLQSGEAPSKSLSGAFNAFSKWMTDVYKGLKSESVNLTPEVRDFMDRLIATDDEIQEAKISANISRRFGAGTPFQMVGKWGERVATAMEDAQVYAFGKISKKLMRDQERSRQKFLDEERERVRPEAAAQVDATKDQQAIAILTRGTKPDGSPLTEGVTGFKIDRSTLTEDQYKALPRGSTTAKGGVPAVVAANMLGYANVETLVSRLSQALPREKAIDAAVEARIVADHGEPLLDPGLSQEAIDALHSVHTAKALRHQLDYLRSEEATVLKEVTKRVAKPPKTDKVIRSIVEAEIGKFKVSSLNPRKFLLQENQAREQAGAALGVGDLQAASDAKERELIAHEMYRAAIEAREVITKTIKDSTRFYKPNLEKSRDMDYIQAAQAVLAAFQMGPAEQTVEKALADIKRYADPGVYQSISDTVYNAIRQAGPYKEISYNSFLDMKDALDGLWALSYASRSIELEGQRMDRQEIIDTVLGPEMQNRARKGPPPGSTQKVTIGEHIKRGGMGIRSALRIVEAWAQVMGPGFTKVFIQKIMGATAAYRGQREVELRKFLSNIEPIKETLVAREIQAPELGYKFTSVADLIHAILHTGNDSNFQKLLRGYGWGDFRADGTLDTTRWDAFIARMHKENIITKEHYDWMRSVWDHFETLKPQLQRAHKEMYGKYFFEIEPREIDTPWGKVVGGYVPAKTDPAVVEDAAIREDIAAMEQNNTFTFPTTGRGATISRIEQYAAPLALNLKLLPSHIDWAMRFIHIEPHIKDLAKIVNNRSFRKELATVDPTAAKDMLVPWLQRTASQQLVGKTGSGDAYKVLDFFSKHLRKNAGLNMLVGSVNNILQNTTGIFLSAVKVSPRHLMESAGSYFLHPAKSAAWIAEQSPYMRTFVSAKIHEIERGIENIILNPSKFDKVKDFAAEHGFFFERHTQNALNHITWLGAYNQAIEKSTEGTVDEIHKAAVLEADAAVRLTQGSQYAESVARFGTGSPFLRLFTMFFSYFNMQANLLQSEFEIAARDMGLRKGAGRALYVYTFGFMLPAVLAELIVRALSGELDDDQDGEYADDFMHAFFNGQARTASAFFPVAGPVAMASANMFNDKMYDDRISTSPAISILESGARAPYSVWKATMDDGSKKRAIRDTLTLVGLFSNLPVAPLGKPLGYLSDVAEGKAEPESELDFVRGLVSGKPGK